VGDIPEFQMEDIGLRRRSGNLDRHEQALPGKLINLNYT